MNNKIDVAIVAERIVELSNFLSNFYQIAI